VRPVPKIEPQSQMIASAEKKTLRICLNIEDNPLEAMRRKTATFEEEVKKPEPSHKFETIMLPVAQRTSFAFNPNSKNQEVIILPN